MESQEKFRVQNLTLPIEQVIPNSWNPKDSVEENSKNEERFATIKKGIANHGLMMPITVREALNPDGIKFYEIIDGFHRYRACKELGYKEIIVNNLGQMTDEVAKSLTLVFERAKVEINPMKEAELIKTIYEVIGDYDAMAEILPYDAKVIQDKVELLDFDWDTFGGSKNNEPTDQDTEETQRFLFVIKDANDFELANNVLSHIGNDKNDAFIALCKMYQEENMLDGEDGV